MVSFSGELAIGRPLAHTASILGDAGRLAAVVPNIECVLEATPERATWRARPATKLLTGTVDVENVRVEVGETRVVYRTIASAVGGTVSLLTTLEFEAVEGDCSLVRWSGEIERTTGLLRMVPAGVLKSLGRTAIDETWREVQRAIESA